MAEQVDITTLGIKVDALSAEVAGLKLDKFSESAKKAETSADSFVKGVERQAAVLGKSRTETTRYDAAQQGLTKTQMENVNAALKAMDAYDKKQAALERYAAVAARVASLIQTGLIVAVTALVAAFALAKAAAAEAEQEFIRLGAVLKATGHAAGLTIKEIVDLADQLANKTFFDDESIKKAASEMTVFKNVQGETFKEGIKLSADMAALFGGEVVDHVKSLGKALDDPAQGLMMLERQFGKFGERQKDHIKNLMEENKLAEAQAVVLDIVRGKVGGVAEAMNVGTAAAAKNLKKEWHELLEEFGNTKVVSDSAHGSIDNLRVIIGDLRKELAGTKTPIREFGDDIISWMGLTGVALKAATEALERYVKAKQAAAPHTAANLGAPQEPTRTPEQIAAEGKAEQDRARALEASYAAYKKVEEAMKTGLSDKEKEKLAVEELSKWWKRLSGEDLKKAEAAYGSLGGATKKMLAEMPTAKKAQEEMKEAVKNAAQILDEASGKSGNYAKNVKDLDTALKAGKIDGLEYAFAMDFLRRTQTEAGKAAEKLKVDMAKLNDDAMEKFVEETKKGTDEVQKLAEKLEEEVKMFGLSETAILAYAVAKKKAEIADAEASGAMQWYINQLERQLEFLDRARIAANDKTILETNKKNADQASKDWINAWGQVGDMFGEFFGNLAFNGRKAFDSLRDDLKRLVKEMIAIFTKRWILQMAGVGGGVGGAAMNAAAQGVGQGTVSGMISGAVGNYIGSSAVGTAAFGAVGMGAAGVPAASGMGMAAAWDSMMINAAAGTYGGIASSLATAIQAIPVWGWIIAALALIATLLQPDRGGPKAEGTFYGQLGAGGSVDIDMASQNPFNYATHHADAAMVKIGAAYAQGFAAQMNSFGLSTRGYQLGLGVVQDLSGTAPTFVDSSIRDASGRMLLQQHNDQVGRSPEDLQKEITLQGQRAILAALQAAELPAAVKSILSGVDASKATIEELNAVIAQALEMKQVIDALGQMNLKGLDIDALKAWRKEGETIGQTFQRVAGQWAQFDQLFTTDAERLVAAQKKVTEVFGKLGIAIPKDDEAFKALVNSLDLSTQSGRDTFDALMSVVPAFKAVSNASAEAAQQLKDDWEQVQSALDKLLGRNTGSRHLTDAVSAFQSANSWSRGLTGDQLIAALQTISREDFARYDEDSRKLIIAILQLATGVEDLSGNVSQMNAMWTAYQQQVDAAQDYAKSWFGNLQNTFSQQDFPTRTSNLIASLTTQIANTSAATENAIRVLFQSQGYTNATIDTWVSQYRQFHGGKGGLIDVYQAGYGNGSGANPGIDGMLKQLEIYKGFLVQQSKDLVRYWELEKDNAGHGEQLLALEKWYADQKALIGGNNTALTALAEEFQSRWAAILAGTVDDTESELIRLAKAIADARGGIRAWREGLLLSGASPLTSTERYQEALKQYNLTNDLAQSGDLDALQRYQSVANALLAEAMSYYGRASTEYQTIFKQLLADSGILGTPDADDPVVSSVDQVRFTIQEENRLLREQIAALTVKVGDLSKAVEASGDDVVAAIQAQPSKSSFTEATALQ